MQKVGRPAEPVPQDKADSIIEWISEGKTLRDWCRQPNTPTFRTVYNWLEKDDEFSARFARARDIGFDCIAQECLDIADNLFEGIRTKETNNGVETFREDALGHRKLQIDTRLKLLAKWNPKKYGDRSGEDDRPPQPIEINFVNPDGSSAN
jgi:hypothetical protein